MVQCVILAKVIFKNEIKMKPIIFCVILIFSRFSYAVSGSISNTIYSNFKTVSTGENQSSNYSQIVVSEKIGPGLLSVSTGALIDLRSPEKEILFQDSSLTHSIPFNLLGVNFNSKSSIKIPTSKFSKLISELVVGFSHGLILPLSFELFSTPINTFIGINNSFNINKYETNVFGGSNTQRSHTILGGLSFDLWEKINVSHSMGLSRSYTYSGVANETYFISEMLTVGLGEFSLYAGYEMGNSILAPNGKDINIEFFNLDISSFNIGASLNF